MRIQTHVNAGAVIGPPRGPVYHGNPWQEPGRTTWDPLNGINRALNTVPFE